jgi:hypothetical protein
MHTGKCDSRPVSGSATNMHSVASSYPLSPFCTGQQPVDSTNCGNGSSTNTTPTADDYAGLMYRRSGSGKQVTTNGGFESTQLAATAVGQAWRGSYSVVTASPFQGGRYAELASNAAIKQHVIVNNPTVAGSPAVSTVSVNTKFKSNGTSNAKIVVRKRNIVNAAADSCINGDNVGPWDPNVWTSIGPTVDVGTFQFNSGGNASSWSSLIQGTATLANGSSNPSSIVLEFEVVNSSGGSLWLDNASMQFAG